MGWNVSIARFNRRDGEGGSGTGDSDHPWTNGNPMKNHLRILTGMVALATCAATSVLADYASTVNSLGPVAYWRLSGTTQPPLADAAVNAGSIGEAANGFYLGTAIHPGPSALASGVGSGATFDAVAGTQVFVPYLPATHPAAPFTVEAWLNPAVEHAVGSGTLTCAVSAGQFASPRTGWLIYQGEAGWNFRMYNNNGTATSVSITGGGAPVASSWYHVVATYDGAVAKLYVNGAKVAEANQTSYVPGASGGFAIGARADGAFWWNGSADEVALYGSVLTDGQISQHYANGTSAGPTVSYSSLVTSLNPLAYYSLNEGAYTAPDPTTLPVAAALGSGGAAVNGAYFPGSRAGTPGPRPVAQSGFEAGNVGATFNGAAGYVGTPLQLNDSTEFTVTGWIRRGAVKSGRGGYFGQNNLLEFGDADAGANIELWVDARGANIKAPFPFVDDQWGFFAISASANATILYANGRELGRLTGNVASYGANEFLFNIGGGGIFNNTGDYFRGDIDEVAVFPTALSEAQLQTLYFSANVAPIITKAPTAPARTIMVGNTLVLDVTAIGAPPLTYSWLVDGAAVGGQTTSRLSVAGISPGSAGAYRAVVSNPYGSVTSAPVNIAVVAADATLPVAQYAAGLVSLNQVKVWFSEPLDPVSAQNPANYSIPGLAVTAATLASPAGTPGDSTVILTTAKQTAGQSYALTITGVKDQVAPASTVASTTLAFSAWTLQQGALRFEHYDNIASAADSGITAGLADPRVIANNPTTLGLITGRFDTRTVFPDDTHENYMARISGFITPTETGDYYFFVASDDASRVYLSNNDVPPNPETDTPIAYELGCCGTYFEPDSGDTATTATPIRLQAGQKYAILVFLKEGGGGDWLRLAWRNANDGTAAADLQPIPGQFLSTYVDPNADVVYTTQPADQVGILPGSSTSFITHSFASGDGGFTVVDTDPAPPGPFLYDAGAGVWTADGSGDGCGGPFNSQLSSPEYTVPVSLAVTLNFNHRYSFEADRWDGGQVRVSVNGGGWTNVPAENFTANGYPPGLIQGNGIIKDQRAFHEDSPGYAAGSYITTTALLGSFNAGDKIRVQFVGAWDDCSKGSQPSWVIKDLRLSYSTPPQAVEFTAVAAVSRQGTSVPFTYQWQRNDGAGFVDLAGATANSYRFFPTVAADLTAKFRVVAGVPGKFVPSAEVGIAAPRPSLSVGYAADKVTVTFTGALQSSTSPTGPFSNVSGATSPYVAPASGTGNLFFRSVQ